MSHAMLWLTEVALHFPGPSVVAGLAVWVVLKARTRPRPQVKAEPRAQDPREVAKTWLRAAERPPGRTSRRLERAAAKRLFNLN